MLGLQLIQINEKGLRCFIRCVNNHCDKPTVTLLALRIEQPATRWFYYTSWWRHQMKTFSVFLALFAGNSPVTGEFPSQRTMTRSFDVFFDLRLNKWLSKQSRCRCFEPQQRSLWRHCNVVPWMEGLAISCSAQVPVKIVDWYVIIYITDEIRYVTIDMMSWLW